MTAVTDATGGGRPRPVANQRQSDGTGEGRSGRWITASGVAIPALLSYLPLLLTQPGQVGADTKTYLYLDPARLLGDAPYLWDEGIGSGSVTHQNIGYLWPMGPFYWFFETIGFPDWVAQRLWLATVMFAAAMGIRYLLLTLDWRDRARSHGVLVASLAYMLSPYVLDYAARISVILLPWAALPWIVALTIRALRRGGWWYPAALALVALTAGGTNATALVMIAPAPVLWFAYALWVEREVSAGQALATIGRIATLGLITSLWWIAGLWAQGTYGLPILRFTESYRTVAEASTAPEVFRGLGYWFFYGRDKLGPWIEPSVEYTSRTLLLASSYLLPLLALASATVVRWRHRVYFIAVLVTGVLLSVGAHPWDNSSPLGTVFKESTRTDAGLALRSTPRAVPLVIFGTAVLLGAGVTAISRRLPRHAVSIGGLVGLLIVLNLPPLWNGTMIAENLKRDERIPDYWLEAADYLDERDDGTRVLEIPGSDFASYRWGNTVDPITPGLIDRPWVARELFLYGTPASAALIIALDRQLQEQNLDADAIAPIARLLGIGDIVHRADLQYERFRTVRPVPTNDLLIRAPGLGDPATFGAPAPNVAGPQQPLVDELELGLDPDLPDPAPVSVFPVESPIPIIRTKPAANPLLVAGGPQGLIDAAAMGLLDPTQAIFYAASLDDDLETLQALLEADADLLLTDTNRQQARRWGTIQQNTGYTERAGEEPLFYDPTDQRLEVFPGAPESAFTVSEQRGPITVTATDYGNPVTFTPDDRPANAVDGDLSTSWRVGAFSDVTGERLILDFDEPISAGEVTLIQPVQAISNRLIREVDLIFDGDERERFEITAESDTAPGQTLTFDERSFSRLEIEVVDTDIGQLRAYDGLSGVGFAEVEVGDLVMEELVRLPTQLLDMAGAGSMEHDLEIVMTRLRGEPAVIVRSDEEASIRRVFDLPTPREFSVDTEVRLSAHAADEVVDLLVGLPDPENGGITARSSQRLPGSLRHRASAALDGDPATYWSGPFEGEQKGHWLEFVLSDETTVDHLDLQIVADGRHSVPTQLLLEADGGDIRTIDLPPIEDIHEPGATVHVPVDFEPLTGAVFKLAFHQVRQVDTIDWFSGSDSGMPIALAEIGIPGHIIGAPPQTFDTGCRSDLVSIDDNPVGLRISAEVESALDLESLDAELCSPEGGERPENPEAPASLRLDAGEHIVRTGAGRELGLDVDRIALRSAAGGEAVDPATSAVETSRGSPEVTVTEDGRVSATVSVTDADEPFWLVLGQSHSPGWEARIEGAGSLGEPILIDGFANGWYVDPEIVGSDLTIRLDWTPQRVIWAAIALSVVGVVICLLLLIFAKRRRDPDSADEGRGTEARARDIEPGLAALATPTPGYSVKTSLLAAALVATGAYLNAPPPGLVAILVGALTYVGFRWERGRHFLAGGAMVSLGLAATYIVATQYTERYRPDFVWPQEFEAVHILGLLTVFLLIGEVARQIVDRRCQDPGISTPNA